MMQDELVGWVYFRVPYLKVAKVALAQKDRMHYGI